MKFEIEANTERAISEQVIKYAASKIDNNKFIADGFLKSDNKFKLIIKLPNGIFNMKHNDKDIEIEHKIWYDNGTKFDSVFIRSDDSIDHISSFLDTCRKHSLNYKSDKVTCRIMKKGYWGELSSLPKRPLETVVLDKSERDLIISDIENFINSEDEYLDSGIPYKRNYLLEGKPGTGKTSLIFALASHLDMDLCVMNFSSGLDDINFMDAISNMNDNSILVLEDIDCIFGDRKDATRCNISFGSILNTLDGIGRKHKLITFMTTNYVDRLDSALIRPGRIDYKLKMDYTTKDQVKCMYQKIINNSNELDENKFYKQIQRKKFTTALLQKYLFKYRNCNLDEILSNIDEFTDLCDKENESNEKMYI